MAFFLTDWYQSSSMHWGLFHFFGHEQKLPEKIQLSPLLQSNPFEQVFKNLIPTNGKHCFVRQPSFGDNLWHKFYHFMEQVSLLPDWMRNLEDSISNLLMPVRNLTVHFIKIYINLQSAGIVSIHCRLCRWWFECSRCHQIISRSDGFQPKLTIMRKMTHSIWLKFSFVFLI